MELSDWVGVVVTIVVGLAGVLIPLMMRLGAIQRENRERSGVLENRINEVSRGVDELRREQALLGKIVAFASGRQAEADARAASASRQAADDHAGGGLDPLNPPPN